MSIIWLIWMEFWYGTHNRWNFQQIIWLAAYHTGLKRSEDDGTLIQCMAPNHGRFFKVMVMELGKFSIVVNYVRPRKEIHSISWFDVWSLKSMFAEMCPQPQHLTWVLKKSMDCNPIFPKWGPAGDVWPLSCMLAFHIHLGKKKGFIEVQGQLLLGQTIWYLTLILEFLPKKAKKIITLNFKKKNPLSMLPLQYLGIWIYCICLLFVRAN